MSLFIVFRCWGLTYSTTGGRVKRQRRRTSLRSPSKSQNDRKWATLEQRVDGILLQNEGISPIGGISKEILAEIDRKMAIA